MSPCLKLKMETEKSTQEELSKLAKLFNISTDSLLDPRLRLKLNLSKTVCPPVGRKEGVKGSAFLKKSWTNSKEV